MKDYTSKDIRNVVLVGATKSGKTTLAESMLFEGKVIDRRGSVEDKNTVSDNDPLEQMNQRSIYATPLYAEFMDKKFNFVDTPGSDDFVGGAYSAFKVCDCGIMVINAQQGVFSSCFPVKDTFHGKAFLGQQIFQGICQQLFIFNDQYLHDILHKSNTYLTNMNF